MFKLKKSHIYASEIAEFLNAHMYGEDFLIEEPCSAAHLKKNGITFIFDEKYMSQLDETIYPLFLIVSSNISYFDPKYTVVVADNPKVAFIKVLNEFFTEKIPHKIHPTAVIEKGASIGENVGIGAHAYIGEDVTIGKDTLIGNGVCITGEVTIGRECVIKDNATIGSEAFSFWYDEDGIPIHFPQIGRIVIGDYVWIGSNSTVERQALGETVIQDHVKIDDLVQIGHGSVIGERSQVCAACVIFGSAKIGKHCWIAPGASIREGLSVGDRSLVGMGSVVVKDVPEHVIVAGNPAKPMKRQFKEGLYGWTD